MSLPVGPSVAFMFTDIESSTRLERTAGSAAWATLVARHDELLRTAIEGLGGVVVKTEGDAFFAAFPSPAAAVMAAVLAQRVVRAEAWEGTPGIRVRMGVHLGEGRLRGGRGEGEPEDYVGIDVNYAARIAAAGNGGQIVLSHALVTALPPDLASSAEGMDDVVLVEDGPRTVKDFDEPLPLYRLVVPGVADDERRLRTLDVPTNLPGEVTPLVGREAETGRVREEIGRTRIVTLTGPGGSGKTRLGLAAARELRDRFFHGVWFVDLAGVRDAALLVPAIASTLGVRESPDQPVEQALAAHLRERTILLLLDNLEQLLPEAAPIVARLVRDAPELRVIATSRELLRISGEQGHPVPPLDADAGVTLFLDRARTHRPDLVVTDETLPAVRAICDRLDGLPLAIELAAARVRVLSPAAILDRLGRRLDLGGGARDLPERQRTLRGAVAWSYELLSSEEQLLFARLGVFPGGWTPEAAYAVADPDGTLGVDVADGLESLADKSLIRVEAVEGGFDSLAGAGDTRFGHHPLLREYALECLDAAGQRIRTEQAFVGVVVTLAETAGQAIFGDASEVTLRRLDREDRNLQAAVALAQEHDDADLGLRILGSTWRWMQQRGRIREARASLAGLLGAPAGDPRVRIGGLAAEGGLAYWQRDFAASRAAYEERRMLAEADGDPVLVADAHYDLGFLAMVERDGERLRSHEERALELYTAAGHEDGVVLAREALALGVFLAGDYGRARELELQTLAEFRRRSSALQVADSAMLLSAIHYRLDDAPAAWGSVCEAVRIYAGVGSTAGTARTFAMSAIIQLTSGDPELGARLGGSAYRLSREKGVMLGPIDVLHLPPPDQLATERLGQERADLLLAEGAATAVDELVATILATAPPTS